MKDLEECIDRIEEVIASMKQNWDLYLKECKKDKPMNKRHKHYDVIVAWASGKEIQIWSEVYKEWLDDEQPFWLKDHKYRIKPDPKPDVVGIVYVTKHNVGFSSDGNANLRLTFSGEDGKLIKAEVIDEEKYEHVESL